MPLNPYFATRYLVIQVSDSPLDPEESLHTVYFLDVPHDGEDRNEIFDTIEGVLEQTGVGDGFSISDQRALFEAGASNSSQEVIFTVWEAIVGGTVEAVVDGLISWAADKYRNYQYSSMMSVPDRERFLGKATEHLGRYFGVSGNLVWEEEEITDDTFTGKARDSLGNSWGVMMRGDAFVKIEKIR